MAKAEKPKKTADKKSASAEKPVSRKSPSKTPSKKDPEEDTEDDEASPAAKSTAGRTASAAKSKKPESDDDDGDDEEPVDDWEKPEEEDNWDPDFAEFDVPKSKNTRKTPGKKGDDDDFAIDDEFKDMGLFDDSPGYDDEDDDY
jgi:DNA-directed RNA polymerase subunit delta